LAQGKKGDGKMEKARQVRVGIGFATGRKSFQKVLKTYVYNFRESGLTQNDEIHLNLLVAYDLKYFNTKRTDYTNIYAEVRDLIGDTYFIGKFGIQKEAYFLVHENVIDAKEARFFFGHDGYAAKRNAVLYTAMKNKMDYLLFLDDDEYPMAVTKTRSTAVWGGQQVLSTHLEYIKDADITNGHHCGYISPIPYIRYSDLLTQTDFRIFIEAISNDIINWETIQSVMNNGGVTYADTGILTKDFPEEEKEVNHTKFISGSNLCINLTRPERVYPFFNPPGARGEDTFLSTCLTERKVLRLPCYTFHDGFSTYHHLMDGVLPINLKPVKADEEANITRFYRACIGWIRYKPLLLYITKRESYEQSIEEMRRRLQETLPKICLYFGRADFMNIQKELEHYHKNVKKHYENFRQTQKIWSKISRYLYETERTKQEPCFKVRLRYLKEQEVKSPASL
jgi:hypothetical protein